MTDKDRYELKIAGLLHDCGKVTTPVHVVDKATKLETIYDRIHPSTRASKCSSAISRSRRCAAKLDERKLRVRLRELDDDRRFLHACNIGSERMKDEDVARVKRIAAYRWRDVAVTRRISSRTTR